MAWEEAAYIIKKLSKIIKGVGKHEESTGTIATSTTPNTYVPVIDIKGRGELSQLFFLCPRTPTYGGSSITYYWSYRITVDGVVITPDNSNWVTWRVGSTNFGQYASLPLVALNPAGQNTYNSTRNVYMTHSDTIPAITDGLPLRFEESCKVEIYIAQKGQYDTEYVSVNVIYRASYVER